VVVAGVGAKEVLKTKRRRLQTRPGDVSIADRLIVLHVHGASAWSGAHHADFLPGNRMKWDTPAATGNSVCVIGLVLG
jgi:hypothetical protein